MQQLKILWLGKLYQRCEASDGSKYLYEFPKRISEWNFAVDAYHPNVAMKKENFGAGRSTKGGPTMVINFLFFVNVTGFLDSFGTRLETEGVAQRPPETLVRWDGMGWWVAPVSFQRALRYGRARGRHKVVLITYDYETRLTIAAMRLNIRLVYE